MSRQPDGERTATRGGPQLEVSAVTTADHSLLRAVRATLEGAEESYLCVAFVQEAGTRDR